jgi:hypothetical protein
MRIVSTLSKIYGDNRKRMFISGVNDPADKLFGGANDTADKLSLVSMTPVINLCHGFSVISSVIDTSKKFISGVVDTAEQLSPVTTKNSKRS